jgi:malate synthase
MAALSAPDGVEVRGEILDGFESILTPEALGLLADLHRRFNPRRLELLETRHRRQAEFDAGGTLDFMPETADIRNDSSWTVAEPASGLVDRELSEFLTLPAYARMP